MAIYEVHGGQEQVRVEGDNWLVAMGHALPFFGLSPDALARLGVDVASGGVVRVTDGKTGRAFELRPVEDDAPSSVRISLAEMMHRPPAPQEAPEPAAVEGVEVAAPSLDLPPSSLAPPEDEEVPEGFTEDVLDDPSDLPERDPDDLPPSQPLSFEDIENDPGALFADVVSTEEVPVGDELLEDALMDIAGASDVQEAARIALSTAARLVPAEAGAVLIAGINDVKLRFVAARGPAADRVRGRTIDLDTGVAGFCHRHGVGLVLHDVRHDERHDKSVGRAVGFETRSMISVALRADGGAVYGCIQLLNAPERFEPRHQEHVERLASALASYLAMRS